MKLKRKNQIAFNLNESFMLNYNYLVKFHVCIMSKLLIAWIISYCLRIQKSEFNRLHVDNVIA